MIEELFEMFEANLRSQGLQVGSAVGAPFRSDTSTQSLLWDLSKKTKPVKTARSVNYAKINIIHSLAMELKPISIELEKKFRILYDHKKISFMETCIRQIYKSWILKENYVGIDIGAHKGLHTIPMAESVGLQGRIFAFEANPFLYLELCSKVIDLPQITLYNAAVADSSSTSIPFYLNQDNPGQSTIIEGYGNNFTDANKLHVGCVAIDEFLGQHLENRRLAFVKIDAEGAELKILQGMKNILAKKSPLICAEISIGQWIKHRDQYDELLAHIDYSAFTLSGINISLLSADEVSRIGSPAYTLVFAKNNHWSFDFADNPLKMTQIVSKVVDNQL